MEQISEPVQACSSIVTHDQAGIKPLTVVRAKRLVRQARVGGCGVKSPKPETATVRNANMISILRFNKEVSAGRSPNEDEADEQGGRYVAVDAYFSVDVETDGPIPGPFSMLSFAIVYAGSFDGQSFDRPEAYTEVFYRELKPISNEFQIEAMNINGLDREQLKSTGFDPAVAISEADQWINRISAGRSPVLVAYPLSFDWTWLYWYFIKFNGGASPFNHSRCFDIKTAFAVKSKRPISAAGRSNVPSKLRSKTKHTHHAVDDAIEQAEIFANMFEWEGNHD